MFLHLFLIMTIVKFILLKENLMEKYLQLETLVALYPVKILEK
jgi:hypothetical protein